MASQIVFPRRRIFLLHKRNRTQKKKKMFITLVVKVEDAMREKIEQKWSINWSISRGMNNVTKLDEIREKAVEAVKERLRKCIKGAQPKNYIVKRVYCRVPGAILEVNPDHPPEMEITEDSHLTEVLHPLMEAKGGGCLCVVFADVGFEALREVDKQCSREAFKNKVSAAGLEALLDVKKDRVPPKKNLTSLLSVLTGEASQTQAPERTIIFCKACMSIAHICDEQDMNHRLDMQPVNRHIAVCKAIDGRLKKLKNAGTVKAGVEAIRKQVDNHRTKMKATSKARRKDVKNMGTNKASTVPALQQALTGLPEPEPKRARVEVERPAPADSDLDSTDPVPTDSSPAPPDVFVFDG